MTQRPGRRRSHSTYPAIDIEPKIKSQFYKGKVVLVTGPSRGIGMETARAYSRCGAFLSLVSRRQETLDAVQLQLPGPSVTFIADTTDRAAMERAVNGTIEKFGRLDIVFANSGQTDHHGKSLSEHDPDVYWRTFEVNVRGTYLMAHHTLPHLVKSQGYFVINSSLTAYLRLPFLSNYSTSKLALNRLAEFMEREHPGVKVFTYHPGGVKTDLASRDAPPDVEAYLVDTLQLSAGTALALTSGEYDWLSGRFLSANWDLSEVSLLKDKILDEDALKSRLHVVRVDRPVVAKL